jgi:primosomal protein N' (replication factor Y) (superfamily II helicase)
MRFRRAMRYPPVVGLLNAIVRARTAGEAMTAAGELARRVRAGAPAFLVLGPAPAPLGRLRGEYRAQIFLKGSHRPSMRKALAGALAELPGLRGRTVIDVDPLSLL